MKMNFEKLVSFKRKKVHEAHVLNGMEIAAEKGMNAEGATVPLPEFLSENAEARDIFEKMNVSGQILIDMAQSLEETKRHEFVAEMRTLFEQASSQAMQGGTERALTSGDVYSFVPYVAAKAGIDRIIDPHSAAGYMVIATFITLLALELKSKYNSGDPELLRLSEKINGILDEADRSGETPLAA